MTPVDNRVRERSFAIYHFSFPSLSSSPTIKVHLFVTMNLPTPLILTNFKTYESATGQRALELAQAHAAAAEQTGHSFAVAVQPTDLRMIATAVDIPARSPAASPVRKRPA